MYLISVGSSSYFEEILLTWFLRRISTQIFNYGVLELILTIDKSRRPNSWKSKKSWFLTFFDLSMVKINSRPPKLKIWVEIRLRNHVKSISSKYELDPTEIKYILQGCRSKKVKNHDFFYFHEFGPLDLSMVKINSRPPKLKIWVEILLRNRAKSIFSKYELDPTEIEYIL